MQLLGWQCAAPAMELCLPISTAGLSCAKLGLKSIGVPLMLRRLQASTADGALHQPLVMRRTSSAGAVKAGEPNRMD